MGTFPSDVAFTPAVKAVQQAKGSRQSYARMEKGRGWRTTVTPDLAKEQDYKVFISPHYLYPHDQAWQFGGAVEKSMLEGKEFSAPIRSVSRASQGPGPTGSSATSPSSRTAKRWWSAHTRCGARRPTT